MRNPPRRQGASAGFTLVELMVALLLSLLLATAMVIMQAKFADQTLRGSDTALRDNEARAAIDLITQDLNGSGFVMSGSELACNGLFTYDTTITGNYVTHHPVDAVVAVSGATPAYAPTVTLTYPPTGTTSDVLAITGSNGAINFTNANIVALTALNAATPSATGILPLSNATTFPTSGDQGILQVAYSGKTACFRIPMDVVSATQVKSSVGRYMPAGFYASYGQKLSDAGLTGAPGDAPIMQGTLVDMTAAPTLVKNVYYIDQQTGSFPQLMRTQYNLATDELVSGTTQPIAAGVVSLQVLFGVDPGGTGGVTACQAAADVTNWDAVRSIHVAIVTRSLNDDPNYAGVTKVILPGGFKPLTIPALYQKRHYLVSHVAVAARNTLMLTNAGAANVVNAAAAATGCP